MKHFAKCYLVTQDALNNSEFLEHILNMWQVFCQLAGLSQQDDSRNEMCYTSVYFSDISMGCLMSPKACACFKPSKEHWPNYAFSSAKDTGEKKQDAPKHSVIKHQILTILGQLLSFYYLFPSPLPLEYCMHSTQGQCQNSTGTPSEITEKRGTMA